MATINYSACPLCGETNLADYLHAKDHSISGESFDLQACNKCSFIFTQNVPAEAEAGRYYASKDYVSHSDIKKGMINRLYHVGRNYMLTRKRRMIGRLTDGKKILDIGTGTGYFLNHMQQHGYDVLGVELDKKASSFSKTAFGLTVHPPADLLNKNIEGTFDVVTFWHVLEHLYKPEQYLRQVSDQLVEGGVLIIAVPNSASLDAKHYGSYWAGYDVPRHLWHFTPDTMAIMAKKAHLTIKSILPLPLDPFYNSLLSQKYKSGKGYFFSGFFTGFRSYIYALFNVKRASSLIYILEKT